jgi:hypothetical protein
MLLNQPLNPADFNGLEATAPLKADGVEPELGAVVSRST